MTLELTTINPIYVYTQDTEPTDKKEGKIWVDTSTTPPTTKVSDGSTYNNIAPEEQDISYLDAQQLEQNINILINGASASSTLNDYDDMFLDIFTDANGYDGTIDTGNTTSIFSYDRYKNGGAIFQTDNNIYSKTGNTYTTVKTWDNINGTIPSLTLWGITESGSSYANHKVIFYYDDATNSEVIWKQTTLATYQENTFDNPNPTKIVSTIVIQIQSSNSGTTGRIKDQSFIKTISCEDLILQTNAQTITANPIGYQVYCHNTVAGTGSVTYDISFDGGTTWVTNQALNTKNVNVHDGTSMIIKLNLNGTGSGNTAEVSDYSVMLYY